MSEADYVILALLGFLKYAELVAWARGVVGCDQLKHAAILCDCESGHVRPEWLR
jgi:hypothetical protein